jgi:hypothetical protein
MIAGLVGVVLWFIAPYVPEPAFQRLDRGATTSGFLLTCLTVALATIGWLGRQDLRRWLRRSHFESVGAPEQQVTAVVIPVSRREQPEWLLHWLKPKFVSFLYTNQTRYIAAELAREFSDSIDFFPNAQQISDGICQLNNVDDPNESKHLVTEFLQQFLNNNISREQMFVDTTGGKVAMSIGAFQAAEVMDVSSIYIVGTMDGLIKNPKEQNHGRPVFMSNRRVT